MLYLLGMLTILQRSKSALREWLKQPAPNFSLYLRFVRRKSGLEIGGPSEIFRSRDVLPLYKSVGALDNCVFSDKTVWADHVDNFSFLPGKAAGKTIVGEGSQLSTVPSHFYDFILSSHNLEHFANPVKALNEWKRVLRPGGAIILVLPYPHATFDHRRSPTPVANMMEDFRLDVGEDDLSHLPEILERHDLSLDPDAGTFEAFQQRSLNNFANRCLHHHVFDEHNLRELLSALGFKVLTIDVVMTMHLCVLAHT